MTSPVPFGKYSTVAPYMGDKPAWVPADHAERVRSYSAYEEIYWSHVATTYKVMNRGLDAADQPVYVPSSRVMIETLNRYVGNGLTFEVFPEAGTPEQQLLARQAFTALFARERFHSKYAANKRSGLIKGDWLWHITADLDKEEGKRLSIHAVNAESYFPTFEDEVLPDGDPNRVVRVKLVEPYLEGDEKRVRVQTYDRTQDDAGTIYSGLELWKEEEWYDPEKAPLETPAPLAPLAVQGVTTIPVYHIPNGPETGESFGSSEMRGLEVLQAALNQTATDEDLTLALMGIGVYATDENFQTTNSAGEVVDVMVSPGVVLKGAKGLRRVEGVTTLAPFTEHVQRLEGYMGDATGATDAARGRMEVAEAESGVALELRLGPTLARAGERDQVILDVHAQMFYDLVQMWLPADGVNVMDCVVVPKLGDKLPVNRKAEAGMAAELVLAGILSAASARNYLISKGFVGMFDPNEGDLVLAEKTALAAAEGGALGEQAAREDEELTDASAV